MLSTIVSRVKDIIAQEGFRGLLVKCLTFPAKRGFLGMRYEIRDYYAHDATIKRNAEDFLPRIADFTCHVVRNEEQADELEAKGYEFRSFQPQARKALETGAIAVCVFVQHELAHIGWIALSEEAKPYVDHWLKVDFANKEACTGCALTIPKYRGTGLQTYGIYLRLDLLRSMGIAKSKASVGIGNVPSQRVHDKFSPELYARVRYFKLFGCDFWKELPINT